MNRLGFAPLDAKLGLVARARLNQDARDLTVARVIRAKQVEEPVASAPPAEPVAPLEPFVPPPPPEEIAPPVPVTSPPPIRPPLLPEGMTN